MKLYGCWTSTFLGNSEMERIISNVNENCVSVWALLLPPHAWGSTEYRMHKYVNPLYNGFTNSIRLQHNKTNLHNTQKTSMKINAKIFYYQIVIKVQYKFGVTIIFVK